MLIRIFTLIKNKESASDCMSITPCKHFILKDGLAHSNIVKINNFISKGDIEFNQ